MRNYLIKSVFSISVLLYSGMIFAQSEIEIKSKVSDFMTYLPIVSANIYIKNTTIGTISNTDGKFVLVVPKRYINDTIVISSIGYKSVKSVVGEFDNTMDVFLEEDVASLDEVILVANPRPKTGNDIVLRAIEDLSDNLPDQPYIQKGFLRHKEKNKKQYKWLIESAISLYDSSYAAGAEENLKINVDEVRKSYDLRDVDSVFAYYSYLKNTRRNFNIKSKNLIRDTIATSSLVKAIKWNDERINGLENLFKGKLNLLRNAEMSQALFGENILEKHQFQLDTVLVDDGRKIYKIKILKSNKYVGLNTKNIFNEGFEAEGWIYIYWDNFAVKKIEYTLKAASDAQKRRSKSLFGTKINHKLVLTYKEYDGKMYLNHIYYETPKLVKIGDRSSDLVEKDAIEKEKEERYYTTIQEILFTEIILDSESIQQELQKDWSDDIFSPRPYNKKFWKNYNVLLESDEEGQLIQDLSNRASLFKQ